MADPEKDIVRCEPCLVCGIERGSDPHHYPRFKGMGGSAFVTDGLLEMLPLCRIHHRLFHDGNAFTVAAVVMHHRWYFVDIYETYKDSGLYLGPVYRIEEVRLDHEAEYGPSHYEGEPCSLTA